MYVGAINGVGSARSFEALVDIRPSSADMADVIRAKPKYSPDLFAENIRYTVSASRKALLSAASFFACVTHELLRTLASRSCTVRLFSMKNFVETLALIATGTVGSLEI